MAQMGQKCHGTPKKGEKAPDASGSSEVLTASGLAADCQQASAAVASTPRRIRTSDLRIRSPLLYPAELWAQVLYL